MFRDPGESYLKSLVQGRFLYGVLPTVASAILIELLQDGFGIARAAQLILEKPSAKLSRSLSEQFYCSGSSR